MNDIYVLTVTYGTNGTQASLFFRDRSKAEKYLEPAVEEVDFMEFKDDFGSRLIATDILSLSVTSMEQSFSVQVEQAVLQQMAQAKAQRRVAAVPSLGRPMPVPTFNG